MKLKVADFNIDADCRHAYKNELITQFFEDFDRADIAFAVTEADVEYEAKFSESEFAEPYLEYIAVLRKIGDILPKHNAFVLHSACFDVDGTGVAFAAHSGTGKTTHMRRWRRFLGDKMTVVNGDKPIVRFFDDEPNTPYAYGTPWNGKERLGCNMKTPLKHICFIERADSNYVEKTDKKAVINQIFNQVYMPADGSALINTMQLIDRLLSCCDLWIIHCNMDADAGEIAYKAIFGE